ncbi:GNAT family N-acetyltransferase [Ralstonia insidiosa]|nr:GNAT family N-acetyltransferase [Ralstonia insidiosa]
MPETEFGTANLSDLYDLQKLYAALRPQDPSYREGEADSALSNVLAQEHIKLIVARLDGQVVATCMLALIANFANVGRPIGCIEHVITAEHCRGRGIGRSMLAYALDLAWQHNCCKVILLSGVQRDEAHRLYASVGFDGDRERGFVIKAPE